MIPVVVLAAGAARRFGSDKLLAEVAGRPLLAWTLDLAAEHGTARGDLYVVVPDAGHARATLVREAGATLVAAPSAAGGMGHSLVDGLAALPASATGAIVLLADSPLAARSLELVRAAAQAEPARAAAVRRRGGAAAPHPVYLPRASWRPVDAAAPDTGLRVALQDSSVRWLAAPGDDVPSDVDTPEDLERLAPLLLRAGPRP